MTYFTDIEDFEEAYNSRWNDLHILNGNRKIISMHIGGIIIECLLKSLIVKKYRIKKCKGLEYWYNESIANTLDGIPNLNNRQLKDSKTVVNPKHSVNHLNSLLHILY